MLSKLENEHVNKIYEEIAEHFDVTRVNKWDWVVDFLDKFKDQELILDLGCGNGRNMEYKNLNL